jgi:biopolymer transport protein ExbB
MQSFNLIEMWHSMAPLAKAVNILLAVCSVYSMYVIVDRSIALRSVRKKSIRFVVALRELLRARNFDGAVQLANHQNDNPVARLVHEAFSEIREGTELIRSRGEVGDYDVVEAVERVIDRTKEREVADLKRGMGGLASISSAAPFIGLFGTVVGIINAFRAMAATGQGGLGAVSAGISEALFTTAVGLSVAIPAVMMFNYFSTSVERYVVDMNGIGSELLSFVLRDGHSQSAHAAPAHAAHAHAHSHASHAPSAHGPAHAPTAAIAQHPYADYQPSQQPSSMRPPPMMFSAQGSVPPQPGHRPASDPPPAHSPFGQPRTNGYPGGYPSR